MDRHTFSAFAMAFLALWLPPQGPTQPVWVPQAPPFGAIASLAGFPDLPSLYPMAGPLVADIRISEWSPLSMMPRRFLRVTQSGDVLDATVFRWWIGNLGPDEPPASPDVRCTAPSEGPRVCIVPVPLNGRREWEPVVKAMLTAKECEPSRPTDAFELRMQAFERAYLRYRASQICDPMATTFRELMDTLAPPSRRQQ